MHDSNKVLFADLTRNDSGVLALRIDIFQVSKDVASYEHDCNIEITGHMKDMALALSSIIKSEKVDGAFIDRRGIFNAGIFDCLDDFSKEKINSITMYHRFKNEISNSLEYPYTEIYYLQRIKLSGADIFDRNTY